MQTVVMYAVKRIVLLKRAGVCWTAKEMKNLHITLFKKHLLHKNKYKRIKILPESCVPSGS